MIVEDHMTTRPQNYETPRQSGGRVATWSRGLAFTLVEVMVVMVLLSLIVLVLMAVFSSTQTAFRASVTQAGVLEDGRATMDLIAADLREMTPSGGSYNPAWPQLSSAVNFYTAVTNYVSPPSPLFQPMVGGNSVRMNVLESFFFLSKNNLNGTPSWIGTGYAVNTNLPDGTPYPLYRFRMVTKASNGTPGSLLTNFVAFQFTNTAVWSHLMDGVVDLIVRGYDINGQLITLHTNAFGPIMPQFGIMPPGPLASINYFMPQFGETGFEMFSNTVPASVQVEMGVLEDRALQRAGFLGASAAAQSNYLAGCAGQVHLFRQHVSIASVDPSACRYFPNVYYPWGPWPLQ